VRLQRLSQTLHSTPHNTVQTRKNNTW
jgi:hypothetical protein